MVEGYLPIFNTDIIPQSVDADWQLPVLVSGWEPRPVLAIAPAFDSATGAEEQQQLLGILKAGCKLTDQQFHILQLGGGEKMAWHQLREYLRPNVVMLFNIHPAQLGIAA
ncbi:MAG: hypothetical protein EBZ77_14110, partial [Chitinophagia bacterium]|nr:hypothetical protein [Chitinophagia bacterium]